MKKSLLFLFFAFVPILLWADPFEIDGIFYNLIEKGKIAEVTLGSKEYIGDIVIPETVTYEDQTYAVTRIGGSAFLNQKKVLSVTIPNSVTTIGNAAFMSCSELSVLNIPNSVSVIEYGAFINCVSLSSITIPNSVTTLGASLFSGCHGLKNVVLPDGITMIPDDCFKYCSSLETLIIPNSVTKIGYESFSCCTGLASIIIPNSVTDIDAGAFSGCSGLSNITIPNSVTIVKGHTFRGCTGLTNITMSNCITGIYEKAFAECSNLKDVFYYADKLPYAYSDAFENSYIEYATLHVPANSINKYKETEPWKNFGNIVALDGASSQKCETPTISYQNGVLKMACATEGVEYVTDITDADIKKHYEAEISLSSTYNISVYATKVGYENSDVINATLCWIDAEPKTEGITNGVANVNARAVFIQNNGGIITINGLEDDMRVSAYSLNGVEEAKAISRNGTAVLNTSAKQGNAVVVKMGEKAIKVLIK